MQNNLIRRVDPAFPEEAKRQRVSGAVILRVLIGTDGLVKKVSVISGPELLRANYIKAIRQWTYKPYVVNGLPVEVDTTITYTIQMGASPSTK